MPADRLNDDPRSLEDAVVQVLAGHPADEVACGFGIGSDDLNAAAATYQNAGRHALDQRSASAWRQFSVTFSDWRTAEHTAVDHLAPLLERAEHDTLISSWWFLRKHPCWRFRLLPGATARQPMTDLGAALTSLKTQGHIADWRPGLYEAETAAFGGETGMAAAHDLFSAGSRGVFALLRSGPQAPTGLGRRELSLLLTGALMTGAGLEWYERGDVWHRVTAERPLPDDVSIPKLTAMALDLRRLLATDTSARGPLMQPGSALEAAAPWADAFRRAGEALADASRVGTLQRGLRDVLAYTIIFHWNRLGLPGRTQSILAWAARHAILGPPATAAPTVQTPPRAGPADADRTASRFPLIPQHHLPCPDLATRVRQVTDFAQASTQPGTPEERIGRACAAWNLAALIAADCGLPAMASDLCHRQFHIFQAAWPISGRTAIACLQPLVNLARLARRAGETEAAYHALLSLEHAVHQGGTAVLDGHTMSFKGFTTSDAGLSHVLPWLTTVLRQDGTRALAATGDWARTARHAQEYDDHPDDLREARQTRIIADTLDGRPARALALINATPATQPWEHAVAACLRTYALPHDGHPPDTEPAAMLTAVQAARAVGAESTPLFHLRLALTAIDLLTHTQPRGSALLCAEILDQAVQSEDALIAREVFDHPICRASMTALQAAALTSRITRAGLGTGTIPEPLRNELMHSVEHAHSALQAALNTAPEPPNHPPSPTRST